MSITTFVALADPAPSTLSGLVSLRALTPAMADRLGAAVRAGSSILVAGPTNSGKSAVAYCLLAALPLSTAVVAHVTTPDVPVLHRRHTVPAARVSQEGYVLVDEVTSPEAARMALSSRTGVTVVHARSASGALARLATQAGLPEAEVAAAFDLVVVCGVRKAEDSTRRVVLSIEGVLGAEGDRFLLEPLESLGDVTPTPTLSPESVKRHVLAQLLELFALNLKMGTPAARIFPQLASDGGPTGEAAAVVVSEMERRGGLVPALLAFPALRAGYPRSLVRLLDERATAGSPSVTADRVVPRLISHLNHVA